MSKETEVRELKIMGRAFTAVAFVLWSVFPIHVLGWLVSAVARHPVADKELQGEPVYEFISYWQGGINAMPPAVLLMFFFLLLFALSFWLRKAGYSEPMDGMARGRLFLRKFLIPSFLSATAFACGVLSRGSLKQLVASSLLLVCFAVFAGIAHYFADTTED